MIQNFVSTDDDDDADDRRNTFLGNHGTDDRFSSLFGRSGDMITDMASTFSDRPAPVLSIPALTFNTQNSMNNFMSSSISISRSGDASPVSTSLFSSSRTLTQSNNNADDDDDDDDPGRRFQETSWQQLPQSSSNFGQTPFQSSLFSNNGGLLSGFGWKK